ncbi:MAG: sialate O-acetylesterase [Planctomycetota bacterium]
MHRGPIFLLAALLAAPAAAQPLAESTFQADAEGWTVASNGAAGVSFQPGLIETTDADPADLAFVAPAAFLGDLSRAYRGTLSFELRPGVRPFQPSQPAVEISGGSGPLILRFDLPAPATLDDFAPFEVAIHEDDGWEVVGQSRAPTAGELRDVLTNVVDLRIIADTATAADEAVALTNVRLDRGRVRVYLASGQSNMSGCDDSRNATIPFDFSPRPDILFWNQFNDTFGPLQTGSSDSSCADPAPSFYFGPEMAFADRIQRYFPRDEIIIIKYTEGGTSLPFQWVPPGIVSNRPTGGISWVRWRDELDLAFAALDAAGYQYTVEGMIWFQGERDCCGPNSAANYEIALVGLIDWIRGRVNQPVMPFVLGRTLTPTDGEFIDIIRTAQITVAEADANACWINADDQALVDSLHFDADGMLTVGDRMANAMRSLHPLPGDANGDGNVDIEDLYAWKRSPSDLNCDQIVDEADLDRLEAAIRSQ